MLEYLANRKLPRGPRSADGAGLVVPPNKPSAVARMGVSCMLSSSLLSSRNTCTTQLQLKLLRTQPRYGLLRLARLANCRSEDAETDTQPACLGPDMSALGDMVHAVQKAGPAVRDRG